MVRMYRHVAFRIGLCCAFAALSAPVSAQSESAVTPGAISPLTRSVTGTPAELARWEQDLRAAAAAQGPKATLELACFLYQTQGDDAARVAEAYWQMRSVANCGDPEATLYVTAYLRTGTGIAKDEDTADMFLLRLMTAIRQHRQSVFDSGENAARTLERGLCAPIDDISKWRLERMNLTFLK